MKRKGFTLIELLAVIIVLAIIALIAIPIVMNAIKKSKKGGAERSAEGYIRAVETTVATDRLNGNILENGEYEITSDGNLCKDRSASCSDDQKIKIEMNGTKPTSGKVKIISGSAEILTKLTFGDYDVTYNPESKKYEATETVTVVYRGSEDWIYIGDIIDLSDTTKYTTDPSTLGKSYYLKHVVNKDNKVTESYACAIFNGKEYCLKGGVASYYGYAANETDYTGNALILKNLRDENIEGISCSFNTQGSYCADNSVNLNADTNGNVIASVVGKYCGVDSAGSSNCSG